MPSVAELHTTFIPMKPPHDPISFLWYREVRLFG